MSRTVAEVIKDIRVTRGLSQVDLGRAVGRKHHIVCRWEQGTRTPCVITVRRLIAKLQLTDEEVSDLLTAMYCEGLGEMRIVGGSLRYRGPVGVERDAA